MPRVVRGVLVKCDPAIKSILVKLDNESATGKSFIVEDLDDEHLIIQESMEKTVKMKLEAVLEKNVEAESSGSE